MTLILIITALAVGLFLAAVIYLVKTAHRKVIKKTPAQLTDELAKSEAEQIFDNDFREELRNRGRLHFENIINENAEFLQQDLRLTTSQLNDFMKTEITKKLQEEFAKYEQAINDARDLATNTIQKTNDVIEEQRKVLGSQLTSQLNAEKEHLIGRFETDMADIINHYVLAAIGNQIDLSDQLEYIMGELEANKAAIAEDIKSGA